MKNDKNIKAFNQLGKLMLDLGNSENWKDYSIGITKTEYEQLEQLINKQFVFFVTSICRDSDYKNTLSFYKY